MAHNKMKTFRICCALFLFVTAGFQACAQYLERSLSTSFGVGLSAMGHIYSGDFIIEDPVQITSDNSMAYVFATDYQFRERFSIGLAGGYQEANQTYSNYQFALNDTTDTSVTFSYYMSRFNTGIRFLFVEQYGKFTFKYGMKFGVSVWKVDLKETIPYPYPGRLKRTGTRFAMQLFTLSISYKLAKIGGVFAEGAIGAPANLSCGFYLNLWQRPAKPITFKHVDEFD